jgi:hypothetical protein
MRVSKRELLLPLSAPISKIIRFKLQISGIIPRKVRPRILFVLNKSQWFMKAKFLVSLKIFKDRCRWARRIKVQGALKV